MTRSKQVSGVRTHQTKYSHIHRQSSCREVRLRAISPPFKHTTPDPPPQAPDNTLTSTIYPTNYGHHGLAFMQPQRSHGLTLLAFCKSYPASSQRATTKRPFLWPCFGVRGHCVVITRHHIHVRALCWFLTHTVSLPPSLPPFLPTDCIL